MIFYESFYEACKDLRPKERLAAYDAIIAYGCAGIVPEKLTGTPKAIFTIAKPNIDVNNAKAKNGAKGGRPTKEENPSQRTAGKFINFTPSDTDWNEVAEKIKAAQ